MGLEAVKEEIIRNAKEQEIALLAEARKDAARLMRDAEKKAEEMKSKMDAETKRRLDAIKRQEMASADMENKKMLLEAKKEIIESVFMQARNAIGGLDAGKREACIKRLVERVKLDIEPACFYCNKEDAKFLKGLNFKPADTIGGVFAENKDMTIRVDYSFETLLESIKENELQSINKILFG